MKYSPKLLLLAAASLLAISSCQTLDAKRTNPAKLKDTKARNVILFIGDGMGISTITAAGIYDGQSKGLSGEGNKLSFEHFPQLALVKTHNLDAQVPDSAGTASAMNTGYKTQIGKLNVRPDSLFAGCGTSSVTPPTLMADIAERAGMSTGIVSTARLTHATPAAVYGHAKSRGWEADSNISEDGKAAGCVDLATQLINYGGVDGLEVALGGGRRNFLNKDKGGRRKDGKNLTQDWVQKSNAHVYADNAKDLRAIDAKAAQKVLGLFDNSHMDYEADREEHEQPSLTEMTRFAIENLEARDTGYFLMVESGRIDHAHHATNAYRALTETQELAEAVALADKLTKDEDTLILVTADHSHVFTMAGYPAAGNPILGLVHELDRKTGKPNPKPRLARDGMPYTTLGYQNGPNTRDAGDNLGANYVQSKDYKQQSAVELGSETHAGEDVALYAKGPGASAVRGVIDQKEIFGIMTDALGIEK